MAEPLQLSLPESFWAAEGRRLAVLIVPRLTALALEGARRGSEKIGIGFNYGIYNLLAEQWAREYTDALLKQVRTTNEAVVGDILARWISTLGSTFGDLHAALQPYFGVKRASVIAVTEATRAMASGELLAYQRAGIEKIQWGTNKDELVCPYCGGVNREVRMIGEPFGYFRWRKGQHPEPVYAPPYHPNCRCGISPVLASVSVRKTVLILTDAAIVARTLRTLPPILAKGDFDGHPFRGNQWTDKNAAGPALNTKDKKKSAEKFNPMKPVRPSKMDAETQTLLNEWVDAGQEVVDKNFIARPQNTPSNIWYHSSREGFDISKENTGGFDFNYGSALYAGKDPSVLVEFYGTWDEENPAQVYAFRGELNMLDMRNMDDEKYYREAALDTFPDAKTPRMALRSFALAAGFDGITYFDGSATGEEHAIFNFDKLENIGVVPHKNLKKVSGPADLAKGDFDGHPFRGNQWTEVEKGIDSRGALWRRYPVRDAKGNATKNYVYAVEGGEDIPEPLVEAINKNTSEGWRMVRYNYNAKSKTWHIADAGEDDVSTHAMFAKESMELNGTVADDLVRGFYDIEQNSISIYDFTGFDNDNLIRTKATEKYLRSAERNLFTYNGEKPSVLFLSIDDMQMVAGPGDLAKHDGPGAHDNGSPQSVHGGKEYKKSTVIFEYDDEITMRETFEAFKIAFDKIPESEKSKSAVKKIVVFDNAEDVYRALEKLNIEDLSDVEYGERVHGFYDFNTNTLYASFWDTRLSANSLNTFYHEFGHSVVGRDEDMTIAYSQEMFPLDKYNVPADLAKHDGPGAHDNGSPQSVHGGDEDAGTAEKTGVAAIDNPYDFVRDRRNTELPMAIENGIDGGPAQSILYHGTTTKGLESLTSEHGDVYITPQPEEAAGYAMDMHRFGSKAKPGEVLIVRRRAGKTLNLTDAIDQGFENGYEPDEVIDGVRQAAKDRGFRYLYFSHPSFTDNEEQHAIISLFPEEDLRVLERRRVKKLAKHDGPGPHDNGSPQSVHGGDEGAGPSGEKFKAWFGDWESDPENSSKVVDDNGAPLVVYKGMYPYDFRTEPEQELTFIERQSEFPSFDRNDPGIKVAGFFGSDIETVNFFAGTGAVYPVYLDIKKPYIIDAQGKYPAGRFQFEKTGQPFRDAMRSGDYDGAIIKNTTDEGTIYITLKASQSKSIYNQGDWNPNEKHLLRNAGAADLAKHDGPGAHDNGSPQSVHGRKGKGSNPAQPEAKAKRPRGKQKAAEVKVTAVAAQAPAPAAETQAPTTFEDWREAQAWAADQKSMFPDMTPEEQDAMNKYKRSSKYYAQVNSYLRTGKFKEGEFIENAFSDGGQVESYAQILDGAISKTSLEGDVVVYRALASKAIPVGTKEFMDKGFGSTSLAKSQGKRFVGFVKDDGQTPAIMNIKVPKGAKAIYTETLWDNGEAELLLPRNTKYRIISEGRNEDGVRIINAEVIND